MVEMREPTYGERLMIENVCEELAQEGLLVWTGNRDEHGCKVWRGAGPWKWKGESDVEAEGEKETPPKC
jgi:hypothetical protein